MTQAFLRPIEITTSNDSFSANYDGGGAVAKTQTNGVYASILTVIREFEINIGNSVDVYLDANWLVNIDAGGGHTIAITWTDTDLRDMLGFTGNLTAAQTHTATYTPQFCWLPTYQSADREHFRLRQGSAFAGTEAQSGRLAGLATGPSIYERTFTFEFETAVKSVLAGADTTIEQARCFEYFMQQCRVIAPVASTSPNPKGFYYLPNRALYTTASPTVAIPLSMDSGGVDFELDNSPDYYAFCHPDVDGGDLPAPALPSGRDYYRIRFTAHTATAPTWTDAAA